MNEHQRVEEQEVRELIADAGPRHEVPAEDVTTIKAAARQEWREMVDRERHRGQRLRVGLALAASVLLAMVAVWWWAGRTMPAASPVVASVELVRGTALADQGLGLAVGGELRAGAAVETAGWVEGSPAGVALRLVGGESLRLAADTRVRLVSERRFELERGTLYVDSDPVTAGGGVEVVTALGTVRDIGTQFEVRLAQSAAALRVRVREGECALEADGERHLAARGDQLSLHGDGSVTLARVEPYGPEWSWIMATAPGIETDGQSLATVLGWVERETGRTVRYEDPALAVAAERSIIVTGSAVGYTPEETLNWVVRISALRHQVENGTILITR